MSNSHLILQRQLERTMRDMQPALRLQEQMEQALRPFRESHMAMLSRIDMDRLVQTAEIIRANDHVLKLVDRLRLETPAIRDLNRIHRSWLAHTSPIQDTIERLRASSICSVASTVERLAASEHLLAGLRLDQWRDALRIEVDLVKPLDLRTTRFTAAFEDLAESITSQVDLASLPSFVLPSASREVFTSGHALVAIAPDPVEVEDETDDELLVEVRTEAEGCVPLLERIDPALAKAYRGAREAAHGGSTDRARHVLVSLRELWSHLLRLLAPDDAVLSHTPKGDAKLIDKGRPTRHARVLYLCRELNHAPLSDFVTHDTQALVKMIEFFNRVHQVDPGLTDEQLRALILRTDSWLLFLLQLGEEVG